MVGLMTVLGWYNPPVEGIMLPHEHLVVDLRGPLAERYGKADPEKVAALMLPELKKVEALGVKILVECTPATVGRNVKALRYLAQHSGIQILCAAGIYAERYHTPALKAANQQQLTDLFLKELNEGIEDTDIRAGFIKLASSPDGPTVLEERNLRAAAQASLQTDAVIAVHTENAAAAKREMDILEEEGLELDRFIWVHASIEPDVKKHLEAAERGVWISYDTINKNDPEGMQRIFESAMLLSEEGYAGQLLFSQDAGWYDPAHPQGWSTPQGVRGYTDLFSDFLPLMESRPICQALRQVFLWENPLRAYSRK